MRRHVLDASALLALLNQEPGAAQIASALTTGTAVISTVDFSKVVARLRDAGMPAGTIREVLEPLGLEQVTFDSEQAYRAGFLRPHTRAAGLGPRDRACLALAQHRGLPVLTADRAWARLPLAIPVQLIR